jgi:hypothetical protein
MAWQGSSLSTALTPDLHAWLLRRLEELRSTFAKRVKTLALSMPG